MSVEVGLRLGFKLLSELAFERSSRSRAGKRVALRGAAVHSALLPYHSCCRLRGRTVEEDTAEALAELPPDKQRHIAAGFRDFSERIS